MNRRAFLTGLIAAPAVVAASNIMPVRSIERLILPPGGYGLRLASGGFLHGHFAYIEVGDLISINGREVWPVVEVVRHAVELPALKHKTT